MFLDLFCEYFLRFNLVFMSLPLIKAVFKKTSECRMSVNAELLCLMRHFYSYTCATIHIVELFLNYKMLVSNFIVPDNDSYISPIYA